MSRRSVSPLDGDEIMSKNKDTEKTRELTEAELNTVSGGNLANSVSSALDGIFKAASTAAQKVG
jgi:bacteriocin-like protein